MKQPHIVRIQGQVQWHWTIGQGGNYVAVCEPLKITLQTPTWGELIGEMNASINALITDLIESNEWNQFMQEHGWTVIGAMPVQLKNARFELPFSLVPLTEGNHDPSAAQCVYQ